MNAFFDSYWIDMANFAIAACGLTTALLGFFVNLRMAHPDPRSKQFFAVFFSVLTVYIAADLISQVSLELLGPSYGLLSQTSVFLESLFSALLMPLLTGYLLYCADEPLRNNPAFIVICILWGVYFVLLIITQFTDAIYYFTEDNVYHRGPYYAVLLIPAALMFLVNLAVLFLRRKRLSKNQLRSFLVYLLVPLFCMLVQMAVYGILMIVLGTSFAALYLFFSIVTDQIARYWRQREENERLKTEILLAQIKPHFIFNSLTAIRSFLDEPEKAEEVLNHFAGFLRGSIDMVEETGCVRADHEFATVENYLYMEKQRFGEKLTVETELSDEDFFLPAFSVQVLVENAVNHGIRRNEKGRGTVVIRSFEKDEVHIIEVEDDGPGMLPIKPDGAEEQNTQPGIGLMNIKNRLALMCNGTLEIESLPEHGTLARILIPKDRNTNSHH